MVLQIRVCLVFSLLATGCLKNKATVWASLPLVYLFPSRLLFHMCSPFRDPGGAALAAARPVWTTCQSDFVSHRLSVKIKCPSLGGEGSRSVRHVPTKTGEGAFHFSRSRHASAFSCRDRIAAELKTLWVGLTSFLDYSCCHVCLWSFFVLFLPSPLP